MKKNFYLVQIGVSFSSPVFLPYSTGCIAAYLLQDAEVCRHYHIADIVVMREKLCDVIERFREPAIVAFSTFTWNLEYNRLLAKELKKRFPEVLIIFGGHSVPAGGEFLEQFPFIDFLLHNEGEESTAQLLKALQNGSSLQSIPNLSFRRGEEAVTTETRIPADLSAYPSPYTAGVFDNLLAEFPDREFHATLETNRGCPYECAYCEWCFTRNVRPFPMERVKAEIEWIAQHKIKYCYCADANFGILDRDVDIARYVIKQKEIYGYPDVFKPCYAKESDDNVFAAGYILNKNKTDKGVTLAYQSLDPTALANIGRKNLTLERFAALDARYTEAGIPTYTELLLGLPGESYESFTKGICRLLESGQNNSMTVYECQVYPNTRMGDPAYRESHGIRTTRIPLLGIHYNPEFNGVCEYFDVITETATMPKADWVNSYMFSVVLQAFHHLGLLRYFAIYLHNEKKISYYDFYTALFAYIYNENNGWLHTLFADLSCRKRDTVDWTYQRDCFSSTGWYFEEGAFLEIISHADIFWEEILPFLHKFPMDEQLFSELLIYQRSLLRELHKAEVTVCSSYNFYPYFECTDGSVPFTQKDTVLHIVSAKCYDNWADFAQEVIWFGKRYSATLLVNPREAIEYREA